uniref:OmpP1/FadL family transporter n=1 Tax=Alloprevotella sp. TaxID=1872471 RepID=UPI003FEFA56E
MKRKYALALAALTLCGSMSAQDIYKIEALTGSDLNGTARYVGMGGAMSALGADLSAISSNPAAIGLFRRNDASLTGSATIQADAVLMGDINKARGSFDQGGFVYAVNMGNDSKLKFVNFAFNYQKKRNLKNYIGLDNVKLNNGLSQSWQMQELAYYNGQPLDLSKNGSGVDYTTPFALNAYDAQMIVPVYGDDGKLAGYNVRNAQSYDYHRVQWGGIQQYDFNLSFNIDNRFYAGVTFGVYNVNLHNTLYYSEQLAENVYDANGNVSGINSIGQYQMALGEDINGTGFDAKFGFIFRPIETSPFRLGFSFSTPIYYDLTQNASLRMVAPFQFTDDKGNTFAQTQADYNTGDVDFRIRTPWKLGISAATTVSNYLALDAEYEVSRYTGAQLRWPDYGRGYWEDYTPSTRDHDMDTEIDACFNTVQTFRVGAEVRLAPRLYGRVGYNYVSAPLKKDAYLNTMTNSDAYHYSMNTDYVNLGDINRVTAGLGYKGKHFYGDVAYQYQKQTGEVTPFRATDLNTGAPLTASRYVDFKRHNVMLTLGCKF